MIDADARSLQLPVFLAAQQSINTLFLRVLALGKVSPVSQRAGNTTRSFRVAFKSLKKEQQGGK